MKPYTWFVVWSQHLNVDTNTNVNVKCQTTSARARYPGSNFLHNVSKERRKMIKCTKNVFLIGQTGINLSKRMLFSKKSLHLDGFQKLRLHFKIKKSDAEFLFEIQHSPIPQLLVSTKLWTLRATTNDEHIDLLRHSLKRIYENCSAIQENEEVYNLKRLSPMIMRLFHHLDLPDKALQVRMYIYQICVMLCTDLFNVYYLFCYWCHLIRLQFYHEFNNTLFDSNTASYVLMDLLFEHEKYNEILETYQIRTHERRFDATPFHRLMVYAACYKLVCGTLYIQIFAHKKIWKLKLFVLIVAEYTGGSRTCCQILGWIRKRNRSEQTIFSYARIESKKNRNCSWYSSNEY